MDLTGRRVLVTGAGQGIGLGIATDFAAVGADVVVNDVDADRAAEITDTIEKSAGGGRSVVPAMFDVTDLSAVKAAVRGLGGVDILVNNAGNAGADGFGTHPPFAESGPEIWEPFLRVNL